MSSTRTVEHRCRLCECSLLSHHQFSLNVILDDRPGLQQHADDVITVGQSVPQNLYGVLANHRGRHGLADVKAAEANSWTCMGKKEWIQFGVTLYIKFLNNCVVTMQLY